MSKFTLPPTVGRLLACLAGAVVLAMMVGTQQGSQQDYGLSFRQAVLNPRIVGFLAIGVLVFVIITYRDRVTPYLQRPGIRPLAAGVLVLVASFFLLTWYDPLSDGKFGAFGDAVTTTPQIAPLARAFFSWIWLVGLIGVPVLVFAAIVLRARVVAWAGAALAVVVGVLAVVADSTAGAYAGGIDHSFGSVVALLGFLVLAFAGAVVALSKLEVAEPSAFLERVMAYRPGLPLAVLGLVLGLLALAGATWLNPTGDNLTLVDTAALFDGSDLGAVSSAVLNWGAYVLFALVVVLAAAAIWLRSRVIGLVATGVAALAVLLVLVTLHDFSAVAAESGYGGADGPWQDLGTGGWVLAIGLFLLGAGALVAAFQDVVPAAAPGEKATAVEGSGRLHAAARSTTGRSLALIAIGLALFYPPTANGFWQQTLTTTIGVYVLLAVGLNVVIGWAGLLDLGFIAFYAIGSYTTAYLTGSLPVQPPSWLLLSPLWAIPVAIAVCLVAGVLLGAPTLRLRGDYLAIVTLGFGEIIRIIAVNNPGEFTNGPRGVASPVPHPVIDLGFIRFEWGNTSLQYWYLLLILLAIVLIFFYRLEGSRIGRAWAAVREDEVAAQATGVNTTRVKLLAFAIGASTSGLAGVFFGSQVGYFNPQNFVLNNSILIVAYVVFGGMGSLVGAIAGAAALTWLPEFLRDQVPAEDRTMWIGAVLLAMMIFRPQGLIPARRRKAELTGLAGHNDATVRPGLQAVPAGEGT
jgi:ABC-type branched-subunit amino acid transport system permease subunit